MSMYRLVLTGLEMVTMGRVALMNKLMVWAERTGVRNVSSGVVQVNADFATDTMIYSCHFDSSHWTGQNFKGFDVKNSWVPSTL